MTKREREITATAIRAGWVLIKSYPLTFLMPDGGKVEISVIETGSH